MRCGFVILYLTSARPTKQRKIFTWLTLKQACSEPRGVKSTVSMRFKQLAAMRRTDSGHYWVKAQVHSVDGRVWLRVSKGRLIKFFGEHPTTRVNAVLKALDD